MSSRFLISLVAFAVMLSSQTYASPVRDTMGSKHIAEVETDEPTNYWSWPTEQIAVDTRPSTVWKPQVGAWYSGCSNTAHFRVQWGPYCEFGEDWVVINTSSSGYSQASFVYLEQGKYLFSCDMDTSDTGLSFAFYRQEGNGFKYSHRVTYYAHSHYEEVLSVPEECPMVMVWFTANNANKTMTVTNIEIYRID